MLSLLLIVLHPFVRLICDALSLHCLVLVKVEVASESHRMHSFVILLDFCSDHFQLREVRGLPFGPVWRPPALCCERQLPSARLPLKLLATCHLEHAQSYVVLAVTVDENLGSGLFGLERGLLSCCVL